MSWKTEFPDYDGEFHQLDGWEDNSWHNDTCPHIEKRGIDKFACTTQICLSIWQDYIAIERRELGDLFKRFSFQISVNDELIFCYQSDDWKDIEKLVKEGVTFSSLRWIEE